MAEATTIRCELHSTHSVELYCEAHDAVFCRYCKTIKHSECDVKELRELCENTVLEGELKTTVDQLTALQETTNHVLVERRREQESIKSETKEKRDISTRLQTELAALIANYEIHLQQHEETSSRKIEAEIEACECIAKQVQDQLQLLGEKGDRERLFLSLLKARKVGDDYVSVVEKIRNRQTNRLPAFQDERASEFIQNISSLFGSEENSSEEVDDIIHMKTPSVSFWDIQSLAYAKQAGVTTRKDGIAPEITGCCFASNSQLCICDYSGSKFSILNEDMNITYSLSMDGKPYDVAVFDEKTVIVSVPERRTLQLITIIPGVKIHYRFDVNNMCYGLKVENKTIYVCVSDPGYVANKKCYTIQRFYGIRIYSEVGILRSSIPLAHTENPRSLYLNADGSKIFYSGGSYSNAHVTCVTKEGHGLSRYTDMKNPNTVIVDDDNNVLVCDRDAKMVQVIHSSGIKSKILLTEKDKLDTPLSMCYNKASKFLVVMCADFTGKTCELRVFHLKFS